VIFGIGIDAVSVPRMESQMRDIDHLKEDLFTPNEIAYCEKNRNAAQKYAARFAAKEAFLKAAGTGRPAGMAFRDIEVVNDVHGKPALALYGMARVFAEERRISAIQVSLTHIREMAGAVVTLET
jgi:holo-[acyl-carrier protein] synthase